MTRRRHLLVIGAQRSGTTYLTGLLDAHPDIAMARPARPEPKVFMPGAQPAGDLAWYRQSYFAHAGTESVLGEKSTSYLESPAAARRAADVLGSAEILVLLRDPVARAVSNWRFSSDNGLETRSLAAALGDNLEHSRGWDAASTSVSPFAYLERGRYADQLAAWYDAFPQTMHVRFLADLLAGGSELSRIYGALGVDPDVRPAAFGRPVNLSAEPAPDLPEALVARMRAYFADSDEALRDRLGRDLPWSS